MLDLFGKWECDSETIAPGIVKYAVKLPSQKVNIEGKKTVIFWCQIRPCLREEALKEAFAFTRNDKTGTIKLLNISVEGLSVAIKLNHSVKRKITLSADEVISCDGPLTIEKSKQGLQFSSNFSKEGVVHKTLKVGEGIEIKDSDNILLDNQIIAEFFCLTDIWDF